MSFLMLVLDDWMSRTTTGSRENQRKACSQVWSGARVPHENKINGGRFDKAKKKNASFVFSFLLLHRKLRWKFASMGPTTISPILPHFRLNQTTSLLHFQCFSSLSTFTRTKHNIREMISKLNIQPSFSIRSTNILFAL